MTRKPLALVAAFIAIPALIAACSSSKSPTSSGASSTSAGGSSTSAGASSTSAGASSNKDPIKIAFMGLFSGVNSVPGYPNALNLAVAQINAQGGVLGHMIEVKQFETGVTPQSTVTATDLALQWGPTAFIGYPISAGLVASIAAINKAGIPVLDSTVGSVTAPSALKSKLTFRMFQSTAVTGQAAAKYLGQQHVKTMMVITANDAATSEGGKYVGKDATAEGIKVQSRSVDITVTNLTEPITAARGLDAIYQWGYPANEALGLKTMAQNGYSGKIVSMQAASLVSQKLVPASLLNANLATIPQCALGSGTSQATKFIADYTAKFATAPTDSTLMTHYDDVYVLKQAIEKAGSIDHAKVAAALEDVDYNGICAEYKSDANHNMVHSAPIVNFANGKETFVELETGLASPF